MTRTLYSLCVGLALFQLPLSAQFGGGRPVKPAVVPPTEATTGEERTAEVIIGELDSVVLPGFSDGSSPEAIARFEKGLEDGYRQIGKLAFELYEKHPDHPRTVQALGDRWVGLMTTLRRPKDVLQEVDRLLQTEPREAIRIEARLAAARAGVFVRDLPRLAKIALLDAAARVKPADIRVGYGYLTMAKYQTCNADEMIRLCDLAIESDPESSIVREVRGWKKKIQRIVGGPVDLAFKDVLSGKSIDVAMWNGEPYVVMIYRSGFGSSPLKILERVKRIKQRLPGVRFVGVHDGDHKGGEAALKKALVGQGIDWPHAYREGGFDLESMKKRLTGETPLYILVGRDGNALTIGHRISSLMPALAKIEHGSYLQTGEVK